MPTDIQLATIDKVDLRTVWENEAINFTPWLAKNLTVLGEALGREIELHDQEAPVGTLSLDVLAYEPTSRRPVVIENQLETTDPDHLGRLLIYASGYDANVVVWIAREFKDEHRQALDWLNQRSGADTEFFGVVVEVWKIDNSRPALHFRVVSAPNEWNKSNKAPIKPSALQESYRAFFQKLVDDLRETYGFTTSRKAQAQGWSNFGTGYGKGLSYGAVIGTNFARVEIYFDGGNQSWNKQLFDQLYERKGAIEVEISGDLEWNWQRLDGKKACRISVNRSGSINDDQKTSDDIHKWMVHNLLEFKRVFGPHLAELVN